MTDVRSDWLNQEFKDSKMLPINDVSITRNGICFEKKK